MTSRREARRRALVTDNGIPTDLAAGPCVELWADPPPASALFSARANWRDARLAWCRKHGLATEAGHIDYHHLPPELRDRAPFHRTERTAR